MKKVGIYMRVGNKEQLELTEQEQIEAMQRIADNMQGTVTPRTRAIPTPEELKEYFEGILPDYDRERVYLTHIKKIYSWYNILVEGGVTDFAEPQSQEEAAEATAE